MKYFIGLCLIFLITPVFGINEYPYLKTGFIANGETENSVKCFTDVVGGVGHMSPTTYTISEDGKIYIADDLNKRIAVYDLNTNYQYRL
jgi:DNA-binding beta-propeller fold protein YncE